MEHGFWGHNSTFVDQQIRTPLVMWIPGQKPQVDNAMTSHMDIVPTLMPLLGVKNPEEDYSEGHNLLAEAPRTYTYVSDWNRITYVDGEVKITQPVSISGLASNRVTNAHDEPVPIQQVAGIMERKQPALARLVQDVTRFLDKSKR